MTDDLVVIYLKVYGELDGLVTPESFKHPHLLLHTGTTFLNDITRYVPTLVAILGEVGIDHNLNTRKILEELKRINNNGNRLEMSFFIAELHEKTERLKGEAKGSLVADIKKLVGGVPPTASMVARAKTFIKSKEPTKIQKLKESVGKLKDIKLRKGKAEELYDKK